MAEVDTLQEWKDYFRDLSDDDLYYKALALNKHSFVKHLKKEDEYEPEKISKILYLMAHELNEREGSRVMGVQEGMYTSYRRLLREYNMSDIRNVE